MTAVTDHLEAQILSAHMLLKSPNEKLAAKYSNLFPSLKERPDSSMFEIFKMVAIEVKALREALVPFCNSPTLTHEERRIRIRLDLLEKLNAETALVKLVKDQHSFIKKARKHMDVSLKEMMPSASFPERR
ncbi:MAG TPA: hypothetical protein VLG44_00190 [Chlamydiales bacterium]|nr:hypothetical protein [Chlamydiales bacterium]